MFLSLIKELETGEFPVLDTLLTCPSGSVSIALWLSLGNRIE